MSIQEELDAIQGCTTLDSLTILATEIHSLDALASLESTRGYLSIGANAALVSLSGLDRLTAVGGVLTIQQNESLQSLAALESLQTAGGLLLVGNSSLGTDDGFTSLFMVAGDLAIIAAPLTDLSRFQALQSVDGSAYIVDNPLLVSTLGLEAFHTVGLGLSVEDNTSLVELHAPASGLFVGGGVSVAGSPELCESTALTWLDGLDIVGAVEVFDLGGC